LLPAFFPKDTKEEEKEALTECLIPRRDVVFETRTEWICAALTKTTAKALVIILTAAFQLFSNKESRAMNIQITACATTLAFILKVRISNRSFCIFKQEIRLLPGSRRHLSSTLRRSVDARFNNLLYIYNNRLHNNRGANNHCRAGTLRWLRANAGPLEDVVETGEKSV
jgi:hypothetical protein